MLFKFIANIEDRISVAFPSVAVSFRWSSNIIPNATRFCSNTSEFWGHELYVFSQGVKSKRQKSKNVGFDMKTSFESVLSCRIVVCVQKYVYRGVSSHMFDEKKKQPMAEALARASGPVVHVYSVIQLTIHYICSI